MNWASVFYRLSLETWFMHLLGYQSDFVPISLGWREWWIHQTYALPEWQTSAFTGNTWPHLYLLLKLRTAQVSWCSGQGPFHFSLWLVIMQANASWGLTGCQTLLWGLYKGKVNLTVTWGIMLFWFDRWGNWETDRFSNFHVARKHRAGIQT